MLVQISQVYYILVFSDLLLTESYQFYEGHRLVQKALLKGLNHPLVKTLEVMILSIESVFLTYSRGKKDTPAYNISPM